MWGQVRSVSTVLPERTHHTTPLASGPFCASELCRTWRRTERRRTVDREGIAHMADILFTPIVDWRKCLSQLWCFHVVEAFHGPLLAGKISFSQFFSQCCERIIPVYFNFEIWKHGDVTKRRSSQRIRRVGNKAVQLIGREKKANCKMSVVNIHHNLD